MAEVTILDALQAFHRELIALSGGYGDGVECLNNEPLVQTFTKELERLWDSPPKNDQSRNKVKSGRACAENPQSAIADGL